MPIAYLQCDLTVKSLGTAGECQIRIIHNTVHGLLTIKGSLLKFMDRQNSSAEAGMRNINNATYCDIIKILYVYGLLIGLFVKVLGSQCTQLHTGQ